MKCLQPRAKGLPAFFFLLLAAFSSSKAYAAFPESATYSRDPSRIFWIMHISDTHIGAELYDDETRTRWALTEALAVIDPVITINTGDLCDGSPNGIPTSGQDDGEWQLYVDILLDSGVTFDSYMDLPGNHDGYGDPGLTHYLDYSLNGSTLGKTTRSLLLDFPFGSYFIYGTATPGEDGAVVVDHHEFSQEELSEMESELGANDLVDLILVFGHHGIHQPENADQAIQIVTQHKGLYFHGHVHAYGTYIQDGIVVAQVNSLGKATEENLAVIAVDNNWVAYAATDSEDPWPFLVITAPADASLDSGEENPYAYSVGRDCTDNPIRVLVFDKEIVSAVTFQVNGGGSLPLIQNPSSSKLWTGVWDTTGLSPGQVELTVTAYGGSTRSRTIQVLVDDVACTEPYTPPDAGVPDSDAGEADAMTDEPWDAATCDASAFADGSMVGGAGSGRGCTCRIHRSSRAPSGAASALFLLLLAVFFGYRLTRFRARR